MVPGAGCVVAILGAECSGKSTLAVAMGQALQARGDDVVVVPEYLRAFCDTHGRTPLAHEQAAIARTQSARIAEAAGRHAHVIADTTALMTAIYSEQVFGDTGLLAPAMQQHRKVGLTLLTGLDLPWQADGWQRDGPAARLAVDGLLRRALDQSGVPYAVVTGSAEARLRAALAALQRMGQAPCAADGSRWHYRCRHCA